jgi:hypothetical protein
MKLAKLAKPKFAEIIATRGPNGDNVSCDIVKTWREEDMAKMLGGKIFWPWGKAVCQSKLKLKREVRVPCSAQSKRRRNHVADMSQQVCLWHLADIDDDAKQRLIPTCSGI